MANPKKHGHAPKGGQSQTYTAWACMKARCLKKNHADYADYGGRGISVCKAWSDSFEEFLRDMGAKPQGLSLDRIDNSGNYTPENCKWSTTKEQRRNTRHTHMVEFDGQRMCVTDWEKKLGLKESVIKWRLAHGWPVEKALSTEKFSKYGPRKALRAELEGEGK